MNHPSALTLLAVLLAACTGEVAPPRTTPDAATLDDAAVIDDAAADGGPADAEAPGDDGDDVPAVGDVPVRPITGAVCVPGAPPGDAPLRRLSHAEYDRTVRDLLGTALHPGTEFLSQQREGTLETDVANLTVPPALLAQYLDAADALAAEATATPSALARLLGCAPPRDSEATCIDAFIATFSARAWRHPTSAAERAALRRAFDAGRAAVGTVAGGARAVVQSALASPLFLYRIEVGEPPAPGADRVRLTPWEVATRLSYLVRGTLPDAALSDAAARGELTTAEQRAAQVRRLLRAADARTPHPDARDTLRRFHTQWLGLGPLDAMAEHPVGQRDAVRYPEFSADLVRSMREETLRFGDSLLFEGGRVTDLFAGNYTFLDARLAALYGVAGAFDATPRRVTVPAAQRAGVLTQASLLTVTAGGAVGSPIKRGVFVLDRFLCAPPAPVPGGVNNVPPAPDATRTNRERFAAHTSSPYCASCHGRIDPVGFTFEHYDAIGRWQATDHGAPVDASGRLELDGSSVDVSDAVALAARLAGSAQARDCVVQWWFRHARGRAPVAADACAYDDVRRALTAGDGQFETLLVALVGTDDFITRAIAPTR